MFGPGPFSLCVNTIFFFLKLLAAGFSRTRVHLPSAYFTMTTTNLFFSFLFSIQRHDNPNFPRTRINDRRLRRNITSVANRFCPKQLRTILSFIKHYHPSPRLFFTWKCDILGAEFFIPPPPPWSLFFYWGHFRRLNEVNGFTLRTQISVDLISKWSEFSV